MTRIGWLARRLVVREWKTRPVRHGLSALAIALGVALFVSTGTNTAAILDAVTGMRGALDQGIDLVATRDAGGIDDDALEALRARPEFARVSGSIELAARLPSGTALTLIGIEPRFALQFEGGEGGLRLAAVDAWTAFSRGDAIVVSKRLAQTLGLAVGDTLDLDTAVGRSSFTLAGLVEAPAGVEDVVMKFAFMPLASAQAIFGRDGFVDRAQCVLAPDVSRASAEAAILAVLGPLASVKSPREWTDDAMIGLDTFRAVFFLNDLLALLIAGFFVFNAVAAVLAERAREVGLLRATGMTRRGLAGAMLCEALLLASVGSAVGVVLGSVLAALTRGWLALVVRQVHVDLPSVAARLPGPALIGEAVLLAFLTTVVATAVAAWPLLRRGPLDLLRVTEASTRGVRTIRRAAAVAGVLLVLAIVAACALPRGHEDLIGTVLVVVFALAALCAAPAAVLVLGAIVRRRAFARLPALALAVDATALQPTRTTMTVGAFALGLALVVAHGGVTRGMGDGIRAWLSDTMPSDVLIGGLAFPFRDDAAGDFATVEGVDRVFRFRYRRVRAFGSEIALCALDMDIARERSKLRFVAGDPVTAFDDVLGGGAVIVSENLAWKHDLDVGGTIELATAAGMHSLRIAAIVLDYSHAGGAVLMHLPTYRALFLDPTVDFVELCLAPGVDPARAAAAARERLAPDHAFLAVTTAEDYLDHVIGFIDDLRALSYVQLALAVAIGAFSIFTTVTLSVLARGRDLALLRAVGMRPSAWRASVRWEVWLLAAAATVGGVTLGHALWIPANFVFRSFSGFTFDHAWPWQETALALAGAMLTAWLATLLPLRLLRKIDLRAAMEE